MVSTSQARMTRFDEMKRGMFVLAVVLGISGCAPRPCWVQGAVPPSTEMAEGSPTVIETDAPVVYIFVQPGDPAAQAPEVVVQRSAPTNDGWTPEPTVGPNPFERFRTWVGDYDCTQGNTGMALRIMDVRGRVVRAIFDFMHSPSGANGSYIVTGSYNPETRRVHFEPTSWIRQPAHYVMVPMSGEISTDDSLFAGKIDFHGCGAFKLKPTR